MCCLSALCACRRQEQGRYVASLLQQRVDCQGWRLIVTGHSLGAGAAALVALKLRSSFAGAPTLLCMTCCMRAQSGRFLVRRQARHAVAAWSVLLAIVCARLGSPPLQRPCHP